ncbi:MAG TPA: ATP-binding protein [Burkholderiales bacterium]|nr:ATP-binding protein [Burkholderiales bacterium]
MNSVRGRLLAWLMMGLAAALVPTGIAAYLKAREEVGLLLDYQLRETAVSLRRQSLLAAAISREMAGAEEGDLVVQVWDGQSGLMYLSRADRELPLIPLEGFHDVTWQGTQWRAYVLRTGTRTIQAALPARVRDRLSADAALRNIAPLLALVPVAGAIVWLGVGFGLRPLERVAAALGRRRPDALDPLPEAGLPDEIRPLALALNRLLERLDRAFSSQRQFVADAAHELRTPLTALQLQLQNLEHAGEAERAAVMAEFRAGLQRAVRLVEQLLAMARLDPEAPLPREPVDLEALAKAVVTELSPLADARNIDLGVAESAPARIEGDAGSLRLMLRNLVDNAVRYTPAGGRVDVAVRAEGPGAVLEVTDTGPGIPPAERERVFDRFYRGAEANSPGSGLGLAIVKRVAERHRATVTLSGGDGGKGLRASVRLPTGFSPPSAPRG